jgi:hypothetical protein
MRAASVDLDHDAQPLLRDVLAPPPAPAKREGKWSDVKGLLFSVSTLQ